MMLSASLSLEAAARSIWDAVVVGAGPAGSTAAAALARQGLDVLLVDQGTFPRWKVCGCTLNGRALAALEAAGLAELPARCGAVPLRGVELSAGGRSARVSLAGGVALSRETFDAALVQAALRAGAAFLPQTRAVLAGTDPAEGIRLLDLHQGAVVLSARARCVVAADGLGGKLLARAGLATAPPAVRSRIGAGAVVAEAPPFYQPGAVYMSCGRHGYVGLVRLEDGRLDVAAALDLDGSRARGGPAGSVAALLEEAGWPAIPALAQAHWRGTAALTRRSTRRAATRLFVLGDAAGYVEPFTGEGMAWALAGGLTVAPLAARAARRWHADLARDWEVVFARVVARRQFACHAAALVLRQPLLARTLVRLLARVPSLAAPFVRHLNGRGPESLSPHCKPEEIYA